MFLIMLFFVIKKLLKIVIVKIKTNVYCVMKVIIGKIILANYHNCIQIKREIF